MLGLEEYTNAFKNGMNYVLYGSEVEAREKPILDLSSMESIGYFDGYSYAEYLELIGQEEIKQEQLIAVIDKYHTQALNRYQGNDIKELSGNHR